MIFKFSDRADIGEVKRTQDGYLVGTVRVARTGIQEYRANEVGMVGDHIVKVYRPDSEVFSADAIRSLTRVPVTIDHPDVQVTADNWKDYAVGEVGDGVLKDGEWLVVNPMIKDAEAQNTALTTHKEISMGYTAKLRDAAPETGADLEMYDLRFNHLALVPKGRAGSQARFGDAANWGACPVTVEDEKMTVELKAVVLGDKQVEVKASDAATVAAILADHKTAIDAKDAKIGELEVKLADAESKILSDADLAKLIDAKVESNKKREAVVAKIGDKAKEWTDAQIDGAFLALDGIDVADDSAREAIKDKKGNIDSDHEKRIADAQKNFLKLGK